MRRMRRPAAGRRGGVPAVPKRPEAYQRTWRRTSVQVPNLGPRRAFEGVSSRIKEGTDVKKLLTTVCIAATALAAPAAATAKHQPKPTKAEKKDAKQSCQQLRNTPDNP